jgi:hypothetical protein
MNPQIKIPVIFAPESAANAWVQPIVHRDGAPAGSCAIELPKATGGTEQPDQPASSRIDPARSR